MTNKSKLPVAIIGGGPVGLAAAAHLVKKGEPFIVFEAGNRVGSSILEWGHVRMFSPWQYNVDKVARELLERANWNQPNPELVPTGNELVNDYLLPLSQLPELKDYILLNAKVVGVARKNIDKVKTSTREGRSFQLYVEVGDETKVFEAKAVIDASGTWKNPNPALSNGIWTKTERNLQDNILYGIPNVREELETKYANKTIMVIGSGHSAINSLLELAKLKEKHSGTTIHWVMRKSNIEAVYGGQENDQLPARGELGIRIQKLVEAEMINILTPFLVSELEASNDTITVKGDMNGEYISIPGIEEIIVSTGFRPDVSYLNEVRINLDSALESVNALAPLIDPNVHSCGTVRPHGEEELRQPEKDFYIVGMKSYGRAPTFLLATGYEQVRSVVAFLTGDVEGSREVHLELPETGVCSVGLASCCEEEETTITEAPTSSCCGPMKEAQKASTCCG